MKRARTALVVSPRAKRPIDKALISVSQAVSTAQDSTVLYQIGTPGTMTGLRWSLSYRSDTTTADTLMSWAIVVVHDGQTVSTLVLTDGTALYEPEQDVVAFGSALCVDADTSAGPRVRFFEGSSKGMRKLRVGDEVRLISISAQANAGVLAGAVQLFVKS